MLFGSYPFFPSFKKNSPLQDNDTCYLYHTPSSYRFNKLAHYSKRNMLSVPYPSFPSCLKKYRPLRDRDTFLLYHTPSSYRLWKNTVYCGTGIHIDCSIPFFPSFKKIVHCRIMIRVICTIPLLPIVSIK